VKRRLLLSAGWIGLILAFVPGYTKTVSPEMFVPSTDGMPSMKVSSRTRWTIGLPFSPWLEVEGSEETDDIGNAKASVEPSIKSMTLNGKSIPPAGIKTMTVKSKRTGRIAVVNWSAPLAIVSVALLSLARRTLRDSRS
jgi:hypothetical protein